MAQTGRERMMRLRARHGCGQVLATVRVDHIEMEKLVVLGYLAGPVKRRGPVLDTAIEAYFSDKVAEES